MVLICLSSCAVFQSLAMPCRLSFSLSLFLSSSLPLFLYSSIPLFLYSFSPPVFPLLPVSPPLNLAICPDLHSPSLPLAIFLHLELSLSCLFSISRPSVNPSGTPSLSYLSFSSGLSISPRSTCSCFTSPLLFPFLVLFRPHCLSISPGLATPSPQGYTSVLQMFRPSQI